jgi:phosphate transport system substrate-binding protein
VKRNSLPTVAALSAAALALTLGLSACGGDNNDSSGSGGGDTSGASLSGTLNGAGATSQEAAMAGWQKGFQTANPDVTVNYDAIGSGGGVEQFLQGGVEFAGSDAYLTDEQITQAQDQCGGPAYEFPVYVSPIAIIYNLEGVDQLNLSPSTLASIFAGKITTWDDPAIAAENPDASLPSDDIAPVHRSDESGTTFNFTDYLSQTAGDVWTYGAVETWPIKGGEAADGTSGVVSAVTEGSGTIGYADASQAGDLGKANVKVGSDYVGPSQEAAAKILDESTPVSGRGEGDLALDVNRTTEASGTYPVVLVSYHIVCSTYSDQAAVDLVKGFESYVISEDGQNTAASAAGSAPITSAIRDKAQAAIDKIAVK